MKALWVLIGCAGLLDAQGLAARAQSRVDGPDRGGEGAAASLAEDMVRSTGLTGGLIAHLGVRDVGLIAALAALPGFLVQGLAADADRETAARETLWASGRYGPASVGRRGAGGLPYADFLVNLLVCDDPDDGGTSRPTVEDMRRVAAPGARLWLKAADERDAETLGQRLTAAGFAAVEVRREQGVWVTAQQPRPEGMDDWTHYRHNPSRTATSRDTIVGPANDLRWIAGPRRSRFHYRGPAAAVSGGGRFYAVLDRAPPFYRVPDEMALTVRDAFSGVVLWERELRGWADTNSAWLQNSLLAIGANVAVPLSPDGPLALLDGATGRVLREYAGTRPRETAWMDGDFLMVEERSLRRIRGSNGASVWRVRLTTRDAHTVSGDGLVFAHATEDRRHRALMCLDWRTGRTRWKKTFADWRDTVSRAVGFAYGMLIVADADGISGISAGDGARKWRFSYRKTNRAAPVNVFFAGGRVWVLRLPGPDGAQAWLGLDPATGAIAMTVSASFTEKCAIGTATERYLISGRSTFTDRQSGETRTGWAVRGACHFGVIPANGMIYAFPTDCMCYPHLKGVIGIGHNPEPWPDEPPRHPVKEVAYGLAPGAPAGPSDWPTYRANAARSAAGRTRLPPSMREIWTARVGRGRLSPPVIAAGKVFVTAADEHRLLALDARNGREIWAFTADARLDYPPTYDRGLVLLGGQDGQVRALSALDGRPVWRFQAAPGERRVVAFGQLESPHPVVGGVLADAGVAYVVAGRHWALRGGIRIHALDAATGTRIWTASPDRQMLADLLVKSGDSLFMGRLMLDLKTGAHVPAPPSSNRVLMGSVSSPLTDPVYAFRAYWTNRDADGALLAFDETRTAGVAIFTRELKGKHSVSRPGRGDHAVFLKARDGAGDAWRVPVPMRPLGLVLAEDCVAIAGEEDRYPPRAGSLAVLDAETGARRQWLELPSPPVFDGLAVADERLYVCGADGTIRCFAADNAP